MIPDPASHCDALVAVSLPNVESGWPYYALSAAFFLLCGMACGYFVWKKGHMQMQDAEAEVRRTAQDLQRLKQDLAAEERELRSEDDSAEIDRVIESSRRQEAAAEPQPPSSQPPR